MLLDMYNNIGKNQYFLNFHFFQKRKFNVTVRSLRGAKRRWYYDGFWKSFEKFFHIPALKMDVRVKVISRIKSLLKYRMQRLRI